MYMYIARMYMKESEQSMKKKVSMTTNFDINNGCYYLSGTYRF